MSDFKAPDVVYVVMPMKPMAGGGGRHYGQCFDHTVKADANIEPYTLTTTAEENTRKAVRLALESVKFVQGFDSCGLSRGIGEFIDQLLTQYQDPQPKEASNE